MTLLLEYLCIHMIYNYLSPGLLMQGNQAYKEKQFKRAVDLYSEAIKLNGNNATYYSNRAAAYLEWGRYLPLVFTTLTCFFKSLSGYYLLLCIFVPAISKLKLIVQKLLTLTRRYFCFQLPYINIYTNMLMRC